MGMRSFCVALLGLTLLAGSTACAEKRGTASADKLLQPSDRELTPEELSKLLERRDKVFFLDVREKFEIETLGSVKGYVNIPLGQLESRLNEIPKDKLIVTL